MEKIILETTSGSSFNLFNHHSDTVIVVIHGASEGAQRYSQFVTHLNAKYNVITYNHPGHETGVAVDFTIDEILGTTREVLAYAQTNFKQVVIFAHSMGTVIIRNLLGDVNPGTKIILSGAPVISFGDKLTSRLALFGLKFSRKNKVSPMLNYQVFDQKNSKRGFEDKAWLASDPEVAMKFTNSQLHNHMFTNLAISNLLKLTLGATTNDVYQKLKEFDLMLVSGGTDVFTNDGKNYQHISNYANQAQINIYQNSYHEVHNDVDQQQLYTDIIKFIEKGTNGKN